MAAGDITIIEEEVFGSQSIIIGTMELEASAISAGGVAPATAKFGLTTVNFCHFEPIEMASGTDALLPRYDRVTDKVMIHEGDGPTTAGPLAESNEDTSSATPLRFMAVGRK